MEVLRHLATAPVPRCAVIVMNAEGLILAGAHPSCFWSLPGAEQRPGEPAAAAACRGLRAAGGGRPIAGGRVLGVHGAGARVCVQRASGDFRRLYFTQAAHARCAGDAAVAAGLWRWVLPALLGDLPVRWDLTRCLQTYGSTWAHVARIEPIAGADSSLHDDGGWAATRLASAADPHADSLAAKEDARQLAALEAAHPLTPRERRSRYSRFLDVSRERRLRAARVGPISAAAASAAAAWAAAASVRGSLSALHAAAAAIGDATAALASRAARRERHHEGAEEEDDGGGGTACWLDQEMVSVVDLSSTLQAARTRLRAGAGRSGLSADFQAGGPHDPTRHAAWREIGCEGDQMAVITGGITWPFDRGMEARVERQTVRNHPSATATTIPEGCVETLPPAAWVDEAIGELRLAGIARQVAGDELLLSCALSMALKGSGKYRLCLDLRPLNSYLRKMRMKMETLRRVRHLFRRDDWLLTVDMVSAYHNFLVAERHQKYCGFCWRGAHYVYAALSFGSSAAPAIFQSMMDVIARHLRRRGVRCGTYIDDWWFAFGDRDEATAFAKELVALFGRLGLVINAAKSVLVPTHRLKILGFWVDTAAMSFSVPAKRLLAAEQSGRELLAAGRRGQLVAARDLAKVLGRIGSMSLALGSLARRMTRHCYRELAAATGVSPDASRRELKAAWGVRTALTPRATAELEFWCGAESAPDGEPSLLWVAGLRGAPVSPPGGGHELRSWELASLMATDCGSLAWGSWVQARGTPEVQRELGRERLEGTEGRLSSTYRELIGVDRAVAAYVAAGKLPPGECLLLQDNQGAASALEIGSRLMPIHLLVMRIHRRFAEAGASLSAAWARRSRDWVAVCDFQGKRDDDQDWQLNPRIFAALDADARFGGATGHSVDMFASRANRQLPRFWCRWWCRDAAGRDAFRLRWRGENGFANPPFVLVPRVVAEARRRRACLTLVCRHDTKAVYWPLVRDGAPGVVASREWQAARSNFLVRGMPLLRTPTAAVRAVRLDFSR